MIRRELLGVLFGLALSSGTAMAADFNCWDGSFGYNAASLTETPERYELNLTGSQLGPLNFEAPGDSINIGGWHEATIYIPFKKNECSFSADGITGKCEMKSTQHTQGAYVLRKVNDLNNMVDVISPFYVKRITAEFVLGSTIEVHFYDSRSMVGEDNQSTEVRLWNCGEGNSMPNLIENGFPERLRKFLDSSNS